jgi:UDPglucose 6-dehydrogenase
MKVCVVGMWHLGSVTAACLASMGHNVIGLDADEATIAGLREGRPPVYEPGLEQLIREQARAGRLSFSSNARESVAGAEVVWITYDTPVDADDVADVDGVIAQIEALFPHLAEGMVVLISSQLVAGCTRRLQARWNEVSNGTRVDFAYSPENLRLGKAIEVFTDPDRVVVGADGERVQAVVSALFQRLHDRILWMSIESAEMTKHALNAFLAMCVSFANEVASICERVGADGKQVERGLKSEKRIGPAAYLAPGAAFAGGTLARDVQYLKALARDHGQPSPLLASIKESNDKHRDWPRRALSARFSSLADLPVAVLGLTYKPGTDTLRRSTSVELCQWLVEQGARVTAHDPRVRSLPPELARSMRLVPDVEDALRGARAIVIATPWPEYKSLQAERLLAVTDQPVVIDANRVAFPALDVPSIEYVSVGTPTRRRT